MTARFARVFNVCLFGWLACLLPGFLLPLLKLRQELLLMVSALQIEGETWRKQQG